MIKEYDEFEFITAYFINNERSIVQVEWLDKDGMFHIEVVEAKQGDAAWNRPLSHISEDELHETTYKYIREQNTIFEKDVITIAKKRGLIYDVDSINSRFYKVFVDNILFGDDSDIERLFMYKLALFESDPIKNSDKKELKAKLRKTTTVCDATRVAMEIVDRGNLT